RMRPVVVAVMVQAPVWGCVVLGTVITPGYRRPPRLAWILSAAQRDHAVDRGRFWEIIDASQKRAKGSQDAQFNALEEQLRALAAEEVASFDEHFRASIGRADRNEVYAAAAII